MEGFLTDWISLVLRWLHVVVAIAWIGESLYFVALDNGLQAPASPQRRTPGVAGEFWHVHGGGFYHMRKYTVAPPELPAALHWSKWPSYTTWISGFALLSVLYLANPNVYLIDPAVRDISPALAISAALGLLALGWLVYDALCRLLAGHDAWLTAAIALFVSAAAFIATHVFAPRAAFLLVGAMLATIMSANVLTVIIPGQRKIVDAMLRGEPPEPAYGRRGKQRSVHNTYFTLPVVFAMLSNHSAIAYSHRYNWAVLVLCMLAGALIRQFFVLRHRRRNVWALPVAGVALIACAGMWTMSPASPPRALAPAGANVNASVSANAANTNANANAVAAIANANAVPVTLADIRPVIASRCLPCHAAHPTLMGSPAAGMEFDTSESITRNALRIYRQTVELKAMPLGNVTGMTDDERALVASWFKGGAQAQ